MKKLVTVLLLIVAWTLNLNAQEKQKSKDPDEQIIVNKKFDEDGNIIQYDSTYIHQWSSDSTMNFSFGNGFPNRMDYSLIDSMLQQFGFQENFGMSPFGDEDLFEQFSHMFSGSPFMDQFDLQNDSSLQLKNGPNFQIPDFFNSPDYDQWQKQIEQQLEQLNEFMPGFQNEEQRREWEELRKRQQKEMEELMKKWEN